MEQYYVRVINIDRNTRIEEAAVNVYCGRSEKMSDEALSMTVELMKCVRGTGSVDFFTADRNGQMYFENGVQMSNRPAAL
jgi:hypothetical protein